MKKIFIAILALLWAGSALSQVYTASQINGWGNFDVYSAFSTSMAPFTTHDGDQEQEYQLNGVSWTNGDQLKAFMIFNPQGTSPAMSEAWLKPRSGSNLLMAASNFEKDADNWFMTPKVQLQSGHPKFEFYVQNYHTVRQRFRILVSNTDNNISSFTQISDGSFLEAAGTRNSGDPVEIGWKRVSFDLSEYSGQQVYIAIHHVTPKEGVMIAFDDLKIDDGATTSGQPVARFTANSTSIVDGNSVSFTDQSTNTTSRSWKFPGGTPSSSTQSNPVITYNEPGTYMVTITATNSSGSNTESKSSYITVSEKLEAEFTTANRQVYVGEQVKFEDFSSGGPSGWNWNFSGGSPSTSSQEDPSITYNSAGTYQVSLTVNSGSSNNTKNKSGYITVLNRTVPIAEFTSSTTSSEEGDLISFTDESTGGITDYSWSFPGASPPVSSERNPKVTYYNAGTYTASLTATNNLGTDTKNVTITVAQPTISYCNPTTTGNTTRYIERVAIGAIDNTTGGNGYTDYTSQSTNVSVGNTYNLTVEASAAIDFTTSGSKLAVWADWNLDGDFTDTGELLADIPASGTTYNVSFSVPASAKGRNTRIRVRHYWNYGSDSPQSCGNNPEGEIEDYTLFVEGFTVVAPTAAFSSNTQSVPGGAYVNFKDESNNRPTYWEWTFSGGTPAVSYDPDPKITYNTNGTYAVTLKVSNAGGENTEIKNGYITVTGATGNPPVANFQGSPTSLTEGGTVSFTDLSTNNPTSWSWTFTGGSPANSTGQNPTVTYNTAGTYAVSLTATNSFGSDPETKSGYITVTAGGSAPVANFQGSPTTLTEGGTVSFTDLSTNNPTSWSWTFTGGSPASSTDQNPTVTYSSAGTYAVSLTATNSFGSDLETKSGYITVTAGGSAPVANFQGSPTTLTEGGTVSFTDLSTNNPTSWSWTFTGGSPASSTDQNPTVTYSSAGTYAVSLTASNSFGSDPETKSGYITVNPDINPVYCESAGTRVQYEWISGVQMGSFNNTSGAQLYSDFTSQTITLTQGEATSITLTPGFSGSAYNEYFKVWIDYNKDGDFEDVGEEVFDAGSASNSAVSGSITPSGSSLLGSTRMRISMKYNSAPSSCGSVGDGEVEDYTVNINPGNVPPPVADFQASQTTINEGSSVSFTDLSTNTPTSWSWSFTGGTPATSSNQNPSVTYNTAGTYAVTLTATNAGGSDSETKTGYITVEEVIVIPYCESTGTRVQYEWIAGVQVGSFNNTSAGQLYSDFTSQTLTMQRGVASAITLTPGFSGSAYNEYFRVWIDYNQDGDFTDTGELAYDAGSASNSDVSGSITPPVTATLGNTRMRVSMKYNSAPSECGNIGDGEVEDYTVNISNSGTPGVGAAPITNNEVDIKASGIDAFKIFPNPSNGLFNILVKGKDVVKSIRILSLDGKVVFEKIPALGTNDLIESVDLRGESKGLYILMLIKEQNTQITKFVIR